MKKEEVLNAIIKTLKDNIDIEDIQEKSSFMDDLEMASMEIYSFIGDLEYELDIRIPEKILIKASTVGELADEIVKLK